MGSSSGSSPSWSQRTSLSASWPGGRSPFADQAATREGVAALQPWNSATGQQTVKKNAAEEELPKQRSGCPSANIIAGRHAGGMTLQFDAAPASPLHQPPDPQHQEPHLPLPSPPRPAEGRRTAPIYGIWKSPHQSPSSRGDAAACLLPSPPRPAGGCLLTSPLDPRSWQQDTVLFEETPVLPSTSRSDQRSREARRKNPKNHRI